MMVTKKSSLFSNSNLYLSPALETAAKTTEKKIIPQEETTTKELAQDKIKTKAPTTQIQPKLTTPEVIRDAETGKISGVKLPNGKNYVGITPKEVEGLVSNYQKSIALPEGTLPAGTAQAQADRQQAISNLIQLGEAGLLAPQELQNLKEAPIDIGQALTAGGFNVLPAALGGAGLGAVAGAVGSGGALSIPLAIGGGLLGLTGGFISGIMSNIKKQQKGEISKSQDVLAAARTNMRALTMVVSKDPSKADEAIILYYQQKAQVQRAERQIQLETQGNLNKFMEDGTDILSDFELFLQPGGYADLQLIRLQQAAASGLPASDEELLKLYQEEYADE